MKKWNILLISFLSILLVIICTIAGTYAVVINVSSEEGIDKIVNEITIKDLLTNDDGMYPAKSPYGMFEELYIPNDLGYVLARANAYENGELDEEYTLIFPNSKGFELPLTGGQGVITFVILGLVLIVMGIILIISINKKRKILKNK